MKSSVLTEQRGFKIRKKKTKKKVFFDP